MKPQTAKSRSLFRRNSRGVAMVEAAVVLPLLAVFFGLFQFVHAEYDAKLITMSDAEHATSAYAVHGCIGKEDLTPGEPDPSAEMAFEALGKTSANDPARPVAGKFLNYSEALTGSPGIVARQATANVKTSRYERTVTSRTWMFCNEQNYEGDNGLFKGAAKFFGSYIDNLTHHTR